MRMYRSDNILEAIFGPAHRRTVDIKVKEGTPIHDNSSLCYTCRRATHLKGDTIDQELVHCSAIGEFGSRITFKVRTCTSYDDRRLPSMYSMEQIAWVLVTDKDKKQIGFVRGKDLVKQKAMEPDEMHPESYPDPIMKP